VLVGGSLMPDAQSLPAPLTALARRNAIDISDRRFNNDAQELIDTLKRLLSQPAPFDPSSAAPSASELRPAMGTPEPRTPAAPPQPTTRGKSAAAAPRGTRFRLIGLVAALGLLVLIAWIALSGRRPAAPGSLDESKLSSAPGNPAIETAAPSSQVPEAPIQPARPAVSTNEKAIPRAKAPALAAGWLSSAVYGSDNNVAALKKVTIRAVENGYRINISNQFNFECDLSSDDKGNPSTLSNCLSQDKPRPICNPDMPDSFCATSSGCFASREEKNPVCYEAWVVKEPTVKLACGVTKAEQVCKGKYTLATTRGYATAAVFTIARRL
jgi:hypothetical protein